MPFCVLLNRAPFPIQVQENDRPADPWITLEPEACQPFWPKSEGKIIHVKVKDSEIISRPFKFTEAQCNLLKLKNRVSSFEMN